MRPIQRVEIKPIEEYEAVRAEFRARVIAEKKVRRVPLGPDMSALFENRDSVLLQVQEMLRTEQITHESAIKHELATYNHLIPKAGELSVTLFVEIPDKAHRDRMLVELAGLENSVRFEVDGESFSLVGKREGAKEGRTTAMHYLKVELPALVVEKLKEGAKAALSVQHPKYTARAELPKETLMSLAADLTSE